jgi:uncharacterized phage-associated protein
MLLLLGGSEMFNERKAAQMAAYLLHRGGGSMPHLKLVKLMYLADRQHYSSRGFSISDDNAVSMKYGPVLSHTLDLINGNVRSSEYWDEVISDRENHEVALRRSVAKSDFSELSREEGNSLDTVFQKFGHLDKWALVDYTHTLKEWSDPGEGAAPITPSEILAALGKSADEIEACLYYLEENSALDAAFASLSK